MQHALALSSSILFLNHAVALYSYVLGVIILILLVGREHTSPGLFLAHNPWSCASTITHFHSLIYCKYFDLQSSPLTVVFNFQSGHKLTPILMSQGTIVCICVVHFFLRGCWSTVLGCDADIIFNEITITDTPMLLVEHISLLKSRKKLLSQIVHPADALIVLDYVYPI